MSGNVLITPSIIAKEALMRVSNKLVFANLINRRYTHEYKKVGESVSVRFPVKFITNEGADITNQIQAVQEKSTLFTIDERHNVAWDFNTQDLTLKIEDYNERYIQPAADALANKIDSVLANLYKQVYWEDGTIETNISGMGQLKGSQVILDNMQCPEDRNLVLSSKHYWDLVDGLDDAHVIQVSSKALINGYLGTIADLSIFKSNNIKTHPANADDQASVTVNTTMTNASTKTEVSLTGLDGSLQVGDTFTITSVYAVNPTGKETLGILQRFVVTEAVADAGSNFTATVKFLPRIVMSDDTASGYGPANQNVSRYPTASDAIVFTNKTSGDTNLPFEVNLTFNKNAFGLVTVPLELPDGVPFKARMTHDGISIRVLKSFDILQDRFMSVN